MRDAWRVGENALALLDLGVEEAIPVAVLEANLSLPGIVAFLVKPDWPGRQRAEQRNDDT